MGIKVCCPHCGNDDLSAFSTIIQKAGVAGWRMENGKPVPDDYTEGEVLWDTDISLDEYGCETCQLFDMPAASLRVETTED